MRPVFEQTRPEDYLTRLAATAAGRAYKALAIEELEIQPGDIALDLGCGPGTDLAALADAAGITGRVIGVDNDPECVAKACARAVDLGARIRIVEGDVHDLDLGPGTVDCVHTDRVLQHVAQPAKVISEIHRVLRPGGRMVLAEPDWDTLIIDHPDLPTARAYTRFVADKVIRNGCIGRQLPRMVESAGFFVSKVLPVTTVFRNVREADQVLGLYRVTERALAAGGMPSSAMDWLEDLAAGPFFASLTLLLTVACLPASPGDNRVWYVDCTP